MALRLTPAAAYATAVLGIPVAYGVVAQLTYSFAVRSGVWPSEVYWCTVIVALVGCGTFIVARLPGSGVVLRIALTGMYVAILLVSIALIHLFVACLNGDCF